jgi:hypothetical protein
LVWRKVLVLVFAALAVGATLLSFRFNSWLQADRTSMRETEGAIASVDLALADFKAAQGGYLATGQSEEFWMARANDVSGQLGATLGLLQSATRSADAKTDYEAALSALNELTALDDKARADITSGQRFMASDVIFMDALEANRRVGRKVAAAREAEHASADARIVQIHQWRLAADAGTLALGLIIALLLSRTAGQPAAVRMTAAPEPFPVRKLADPLPALDPQPAPTVNIGDAAELCVDLARVLDVRDLPALLGRAASVLGAKGLVLWVVDRGTAELRPSLAHGYSDKVLQRMGPLPTSADNVTSLAYRTLKVQLVRGSADGQGAIAVPLIAPAGCVGVLSAEVQGGKAGDTRSDVARMIAAQLATLVAPTESAPAQQTAQG